MIETVGAVMVKDGKVLLGLRAAHKSFAGRWDVIGGHVEAGEEPWQALCGELREEVGVDAIAGTFIDTFSIGAVPLHLFLVSEWKGDPSRCNDEHAEVRWFDPAEAAALLELLSSDYRPVLVALARGGSAVDHATGPG